MAIMIKSQLVSELLTYLSQQPEADQEADRLYNELLAEQADQNESENRTKGGAWIV